MGKPRERLPLTSAVASLLVFMTVWASAARADTGTHYLCIQNGQRSFSKTPQGGSCSVLREHDDPGWVNMVFAPNVIVSYYPPSIVREAGTVKVWVQVNLASPVPFVGPDGSDKFQYDSVRAAYRLFCTEQQQVLIQGTYSLGTKSVYERSSSEQIREEIQPNTLAETFLNFFCHGSGGAAASSQPRSSNFQFVCPESLPNDKAREEKLAEFLRWVATFHPEVNTVRAIATMRLRLLEEHHCEETLKNIRGN